MEPDHRPRRAGQSGGRARTRMALSQNFLRSIAVVKRLVDTSEVSDRDTVVEVGPGAGIITHELASRVAEVLAYEKDPKFARRIQREFVNDPRVSCINADFREVEPPSGRFQVVANVPFGITTEIVRWCLDAETLDSATLITQEEFAKKHTGMYGTWSRLAIINWPTVEFAFRGRIDRQSFYPPPRVDAAILSLRRRVEPLVPHRWLDDYRELVEIGFTGVGGSLVASLRRRVPRRSLDRGARAAALDSDTPVGLVRPEQWIELYREVCAR